MAGFLARIFGREDAAMADAVLIYRTLMEQARHTEFYGEGKVADSYNGRIDLLTLHIAVVLNALSGHGAQGERLSQAIYDVMRDDFEIALREEGMSDTGVKRRIKPIMRLFFTRVKSYVEALQSNSKSEALVTALSEGLLPEGQPSFRAEIADYAIKFFQRLEKRSLGKIAKADFSFPPLSN